MAEALIPDFQAIQAALGNRRAKVALRRRLARAIALLVDVLDVIDGDADLEPSLGSGNPSPPTAPLPWIGPGQVIWLPMADHLAFAHGGADDREEEPFDVETMTKGPATPCHQERRRRPVDRRAQGRRAITHG